MAVDDAVAITEFVEQPVFDICAVTEAEAMHHDYLAARGLDLDAMDDEQRAAATDRQFVGSPDEVAAQVQERVLDRGVDGVVFNMVANGHEPGVVEMAVSALAPLVR